MSSHRDEPVFVDQHIIEMSGSRIPDEAPVCYGGFNKLSQRERGCHHCAFFGKCIAWSAVNRRPDDNPESDPNGIPQHSPGAKLDAGKTRLWLVFSGFANALEEVGKVGTFGAKKHCDDGWKSVPDGYARYSSAMLRHIMKEARGEAIDPDFGLLHAAHTAWNALARLELLLAERGKLE